MNDVIMTVVGNLVEDPRLRETKNGHRVANFRIASTSSRFDRESGSWVDNHTFYVTVTAWRGLAENVAASLFKGQPVIVHGRYQQRDYEENEERRVAYALEALAVGHDLSRGTSTFSRRYRAATAVALDPEGRPADASDHFVPEVEDDDAPAGDAVDSFMASA